MPLETYQDFLELDVNELKDYLSVRDVNLRGNKIELVAKAFIAMELKFEVVRSKGTLAKGLFGKRVENLRKIHCKGRVPFSQIFCCTI